jgi:arylsulfatase A-like enzyme
VEFTQAIATSSWTLESHASLFTGLYPPQVFTDDRTPINYETPMPGGPPTIAEVLGRQGYLTGGFVANTNYTDREHGLNRGFAHYDDHPFAWTDVIASSGIGFNFTERIRRYGGRPVPVGMRNAWQITSSFLQWFDRQNGRPVFAFLNLFDAHDPYVPDPQFKTGPQVKDPRLNPYYSYSSGEIGPLKHAYDDCVRYLDHVVGRLADELQRRGQLDNTVLVVTSDHGEHFGEHGLVSHGNSLYRHLLQVPLLMRYPPAIPAGARVDQPISLRDVPATLLSMAGVPGATLPGTPLAWLWDPDQESRTASPILSSLIIGKTPHHFAPATWPVSRGAMRSVVAEGLHFIVNGDGREELYDWASDLEETRDLSASAAQAEARRRLRAMVKLIEAGR